jgi:hypothetical protein
MKNILLLLLIVSITGCDTHKNDQKIEPIYEKKWDDLPQDEQVLGPLADPKDLDTVSVRENRQPQAFDEDHMMRDGHAHRAGFFQ